jgi:CRISPR-associated protein Cas1
MGKHQKCRKIVLNESGYFLRRKQGAFVVSEIRSRRQVEKYPILEGELGEIQVVSGNLLSSGALVTAAFNRIPVILKTNLGSPVAIMVSVDDCFSHAETRIFQLTLFQNIQSLMIPKEIVLAKLRGQNEVLKKYGLKRIGFEAFDAVKQAYQKTLSIKELDEYIEHDRFPKDALGRLRLKLLQIEGHASRFYFKQIFDLLPESLRPTTRKGFKAYDGVNNTLSLGYRILSFKVLKALISAKLEPYLGFYHTPQYGSPSLVNDFMEIYRYLIDDFTMGFCRRLEPKDFVLKSETFAGRKGKRAFLGPEKNRQFLNALEALFQTKVEVPRVRRGKRQEIETLIGEEALLLARFVRSQQEHWVPRVAILSPCMPQGMRGRTLPLAG